MFRYSALSGIVAASILIVPMASALDNSVRIQELAGRVRTNFPVTVMATIARGEILGYARPAVTIYNANGSVRTPRRIAEFWQSDVKTRWRDNETQVAIERVENPATVVCPSPQEACATSPFVRIQAQHDFRDGEGVRITGSAIAELNGSWTVVDRNDTGFSLAGLASVPDPSRAGGEVHGTVNGSWATGLVTVFIDTLPANGSARIDFVNDFDPSHNPSSNGLSPAEMLTRDWDAVMEVSTPVRPDVEGTVRISARTILEQTPESECGPRKWLGGPLVTEYIVENQCLAASPPYDFGWKPMDPVVSAVAVDGVQSDGAQTLELAAAPGFNASDTEPVLLHYSTRGPSLLASLEVEFFRACEVRGTTVRICAGGRGVFASKIRAIPARAEIGVVKNDRAGDAHRNFHPWFLIRAYSEANGTPFNAVRMQYVLSNTNLDKPGTGYIGVTMHSKDGRTRWKSGLAPEQYESGAAREFFFQAGTEISKTFWDGTDLEHECAGSTTTDPCRGSRRERLWLLDPNLDYKVHAGFILPFDKQEMRTTGDKNPFQLEYDRFTEGDRGDVGVPVSLQGRYTFGNYPYSFLIQGYSNYSAAEGRRWAGGDDNDREEGWVWSRALARTLPVLGSEPRAWEILFGTSLPGGGGLREVEHHLPLNWREGSAELGKLPYSLASCEQCTAFGRTLSLDVRPTIYTLKPDSPEQTALHRMNYKAYGSMRPSSWHDFRFPGVFQVGDQTLDSAHRMPHAPYIYLLTGDYYDLLQTQSMASWMAGFKNPGTMSGLNQLNGSLLRHANWGIMAAAASHTRAAAWPILSVGWAAALSPNTPGSGANSSPPPERYYFEAKLAKTFQAWEGMTGMTNGRFPPRNPSCDDVGFQRATSGVTTMNTNDPWCWGRQEMGRNQPMPLSITARPDQVEPSVRSTAVIRERAGGTQTPFNLAQTGVALWQVSRLGLDMVKPIYERHGRMSINMVQNSQIPTPMVATHYHWPWFSAATEYKRMGLDGEETVTGYSFFPSWGAMIDAFAPTVKLDRFENTVRMINEIGYAHYWRSSLAGWAGSGLADNATPGCRPAEVPPNGCTADGAYKLLRQAMGDFVGTYRDAKRTAQVPLDRVRVALIRTTGTQAEVTYEAPENMKCTHRLFSEGPADSLDEGEAEDSARQTNRSLRLDNLTVGQIYWLRLTCGNGRTTAAFRAE